MTWQKRMAALVAQRLGIELRPSRTEDSLDRFVRRRARALRLPDGDAYVSLLGGQTTQSREFTQFIAAVTIGYTFFFRNIRQLKVIAEVLSERADAGHGPGRIWCACCSTGEEAYSLAMLLAEQGVDAEILATDIDAVALGAARTGEYADWSLRSVPKALREEYFERVGDRHRVRRHIRERVSFRRQNVVYDPPPRSLACVPWDVIVCRNAFIYYTGDALRAATQHIMKGLAPDGLVFLGSSESMRAPMVPVGIKGQVAYRPGTRFIPRQKTPTPMPTPRRTSRFRRTPPVSVAPSPRYDHALDLLRSGDEKLARAVLEKVVQSNPDRVPAWVTLGNVSLRVHAFEQALHAYGEAQKRDPLLPEVHYFLGMTYRKLGDLQRAAHSLRSTLFLDPGFWPASFLLAGVHGRLGNWEKRRAQLHHTLEAAQTPGSEPLFRSRGHEPLHPIGSDAVAAACRQLLRERRVA
ncbi:MAG: tetratricopeptide repeat protein [Deltaproteobacteria bacterium]|nr:tetratricopeptide repeat protein [Deltaproteobacteria bacterium]